MLSLYRRFFKSGVSYTTYLSFFIEGKGVGRYTVMSLRDHPTLWINFFFFFAIHCCNANTNIYACAFIVRHVLPIFIPGMMFPQIFHIGPDEEAVTQ